MTGIPGVPGWHALLHSSLLADAIQAKRCSQQKGPSQHLRLLHSELGVSQVCPQQLPTGIVGTEANLASGGCCYVRPVPDFTSLRSEPHEPGLGERDADPSWPNP